jgi:hypothetical protein
MRTFTDRRISLVASTLNELLKKGSWTFDEDPRYKQSFGKHKITLTDRKARLKCP